MVRKRQWFLLGLVGTVVGLAVRLVRGRRAAERGAPLAPPGRPSEE